jgi:hypothetical protein
MARPKRGIKGGTLPKVGERNGGHRLKPVPQPGEFTFERTGDNTYSGTWREGNIEHGTISFVVSEDGKKITGTWTSDEDSTIRPKKEGPILWTRK